MGFFLYDNPVIISLHNCSIFNALYNNYFNHLTTVKYSQTICDLSNLLIFCFLDAFQAHQKMPLTSSLRIPQKMPLEANNFGVSSSEVTSENVNGTDMYGTGLKNEVGEYNCFLNVIIQVGVPQPYFWWRCPYWCAFHVFIFLSILNLWIVIFSGLNWLPFFFFFVHTFSLYGI